MLFMLLKVPYISIHQRLVTLHNQKVLSILLFSGLGEIETSGYQGTPVQDHYLVMYCNLDSVTIKCYINQQVELLIGVTIA
jgi:hypothetical protein